jgi:hypothetical protein
MRKIFFTWLRNVLEQQTNDPQISASLLAPRSPGSVDDQNPYFIHFIALMITPLKCSGSRGF